MNINNSKEQIGTQKLLSESFSERDFKKELKDAVTEAERKVIYHCVEYHKYNITKAAESLGINRKTLYNWAKKNKVRFK